MANVPNAPQAQDPRETARQRREAKAVYKANRGWFARHKFLTFLGVVAIAIILIVAFTSCGGDTDGDVANAPDAGSADVENGGGENEDEQLTVSQENAIGSAESYLDTGAFSRKGLIDQLSSDIEGYSKKDAKFAVDHVEVDWKAEALESAEGYLATSNFSCDGMVDQLSSFAEQFTQEQAEYAAKEVGLC